MLCALVNSCRVFYPRQLRLHAQVSGGLHRARGQSCVLLAQFGRAGAAEFLPSQPFDLLHKAGT